MNRPRPAIARSMRVRFRRKPSRPAGPAPVAPANQETEASPAAAPAEPPAPAPTPAPHAAESPAPAVAAGAVPQLVLNWFGPYRVKVREEFTTVLRMNSSADVRTLPLEIRFDPQVFTFVDAQASEAARRSGTQVQVKSVDAAGGALRIELRAGEGRTLRGQGDLLMLRFASVAASKLAQLTITKQDLKDDAGTIAASVRSTPLTLRVTGS